MKKGIFTLLLAAIAQLTFAETYYWIGGTSFTSFSSASNWNTQLGGGGTNLTSSISGTNSITHTFIIDGSDLDDDPGSQTGPMVGSFTGTLNVGQLFIQNLADVSLARTGSGTTTITIYGGTGTDFYIDPTSKLTIGGTDGSLFIVLGNAVNAAVNAEVAGHIVFKDGQSSGNNNRITSRTPGAFVFLSGSSATTESTYNSYPFNTTGSSTPGVARGVVFNAGSHFYYNGGLSPFGSNSTSYLVEFMPGSKFHFRAPVANTQMFSNRPYGDIFVENNATVAADGTLARVDSFVVASGATFITDSSGSTPISGHLVVNGSFIVPATNPSRTNRLAMVGQSPQNISGTGTMTLGRLFISNQSNVTLQRSVQVDSLTMVVGMLNPNGNSITGAGTLDVKSPASLNVTGNTVVDSFLVTGISNMTGIEVGMSVTGTGIASNTVVTNYSSANMTITLSKAATASGTGVALNIFNGQGSILPIRFGAISANLVNGQTKIVWNVLLEENIIRYVIERSTDAANYNEVGIVSASRSSQYNFTDVAPAAGVNYYRIKVLGKDGEVKYSNVLRVNNARGKAELSLYPNPVRGNNVSIQMNNFEKGAYQLRVVNTSGQTVFTQAINHNGGSANQTLALPASVQKGIYNVIVAGENHNLLQRIVVE